MKQAVVIIHGIGEQKPMSTLRGFVRAVLPPAKDGGDAYWSKPDAMSELFELRRLQGRGRPITHFYEYYWAYNAEGTTIWHVIAWLFSLIRRRGRDVPESARSLWLIARLLLLAFIGLTAVGAMAKAQAWFSALAVFGGAWVLVALLGLGLQFALIQYLGDAARYCSATPKNIKLRQTVRSEGLQLLRTLHEAREYDRIIVVGHSLGSVIGYDLLTRLWQEYNEDYSALKNADSQAAIRAALEAKESPQSNLRDKLPEAGQRLSSDAGKEALEGFRNAQLETLHELHKFGNPWRISDFITLGSPLAHAMLLVADSKEDFESRIRQRELPTCPPQLDTKGYAYSWDTVDIGNGKKFTPLILHHAAPFAVTRWTNLYFPAFAGLFGDFVGGPLRGVFGKGIKDVKVRTGHLRGLANVTLLAHTNYWNPSDVTDAEDGTAEQLSLMALRQALALTEWRKFEKHGTQAHKAEEDEPAMQ